MQWRVPPPPPPHSRSLLRCALMWCRGILHTHILLHWLLSRRVVRVVCVCPTRGGSRWAHHRYTDERGRGGAWRAHALDRACEVPVLSCRALLLDVFGITRGTGQDCTPCSHPPPPTPTHPPTHPHTNVLRPHTPVPARGTPFTHAHTRPHPHPHPHTPTPPIHTPTLIAHASTRAHPLARPHALAHAHPHARTHTTATHKIRGSEVPHHRVLWSRLRGQALRGGGEEGARHLWVAAVDWVTALMVGCVCRRGSGAGRHLRRSWLVPRLPFACIVGKGGGHGGGVEGVGGARGRRCMGEASAASSASRPGSIVRLVFSVSSASWRGNRRPFAAGRSRLGLRKVMVERGSMGRALASRARGKNSPLPSLKCVGVQQHPYCPWSEWRGEWVCVGGGARGWGRREAVRRGGGAGAAAMLLGRAAGPHFHPESGARPGAPWCVSGAERFPAPGRGVSRLSAAAFLRGAQLPHGRAP